MLKDVEGGTVNRKDEKMVMCGKNQEERREPIRKKGWGKSNWKIWVVETATRQGHRGGGGKDIGVTERGQEEGEGGKGEGGMDRVATRGPGQRKTV